MKKLALQARSRDTEQRITAAARDLLLRRPLEEVKMTEIAERAGVSVGGLYARFPSKEALAGHLVDQRVFDRMERETEEMIAERGTIEEIVRRYLTSAVSLYRRNRFLLRAVYVATRAGDDRDLKQRVRAFNVALHGRLRAAILARRSDIGHPRPEVAVGLAIQSMMTTLREVVLFEQPVSDLVQLSDEELVTELTRAFLAYAEVKKSKRSRS